MFSYLTPLSFPRAATQPAPAMESRADGDLELSILMPCLNEAETLATCIRKAQRFLQDSAISGEIIVADNGSTDGSQAIAQRLGARVVEAAERGYGAALAEGIAAARGRYIIMGDSDDSYDFTALAPFVAKLRQGFDLVVGNRFMGGIKSGAMPLLHKYLGNPALTMIGRLFFKSPCGDFYCGLRGFKSAAVRSLALQSKGMEFALEMIVRATMLGMRITEVPTTLSPDGRSGRPHLRTWRDGWRSLRFLLLYSPRWLFLYPGIGLMAVGALLGLWLIPGREPIGNIVLDVHTMLYCATAVVLGFQAVIFSFFGKIAAMHAGFHPRNAKVEKWFRTACLESGLAIGATLVVIGLGLSAYAVWSWGGNAFGALDPFTGMRIVIPAMLALMLGSLTLFASFYFSLLQLQSWWLGRQGPPGETDRREATVDQTSQRRVENQGQASNAQRHCA